MADIQVEQVESERSSDNDDLLKGRNFSKQFLYTFIFSVTFLVISVLVFIWGHSLLDLDVAADNSLLGTFGDFVGGVLGTGIALYSAYVLVETFCNQIKVNQSVIRTNEVLVEQTKHQLFDVKFTTFLKLYHDAIGSYVKDDLNGRACFENLANEFLDETIKNERNYNRRSAFAKRVYHIFYSKYRRFLSVHFRMLYLLVKLTADECMDEDHRVAYAKCIRGQLTENELLVLRYNCLNDSGEKMRTYVNHFNLLKHLPIMRLLEFSKWRELMGADENINSFEQMIKVVRKKLTSLLESQDEINRLEHMESGRLKFIMECSERKDNIIIQIEFNIRKRKNNVIERPQIEKAMDSIPLNELPNLFKDVFSEMFVTSNFFLYNGKDDHIVQVDLLPMRNNKCNLEICIHRGGNRLALAQRQVAPE